MMLEVTATDLPRLLACNGSRLVEGYQFATPEDDTIRKEGDAAHWVIEQVFKHKVPLDSLLNKQAANGIFITADMLEHVTAYLDDITKLGGQVEFDTSFQDVNGKWRVNGRADHLYQGNGTLQIRDFKYGYKIVEPKDNWTLIWHACGFFLRAKAAGINYDPSILSVVEFYIYQPRAYHHKGPVRKVTLMRGWFNDLWAKMEGILENPDEMLNTGPHCYKCPVMINKDGGVCPAYNKAFHNALEASEQVFTHTINNQDLSRQLKVCSRAAEIVKQMNSALEDLAIDRVRKGQVVPDYTIERSMGNREWKPTVTPEFVKMMTGKDISNQKLMTPAQAEKMGLSKDFVASMTHRQEKGLNLVRADADEQGQKMFNQPKGN